MLEIVNLTQMKFYCMSNCILLGFSLYHFQHNTMQQWTFCSTDISRYFEHSITPWLPTLNKLGDLHIVRLHALEGDAAGGSLLQDYH